MLLVTVGLLGGALLARDGLEQTMGLTTHEGFYAAFFPHWLLNTFFPFFTGLAFIVAVMGIVRFWGAMKRADAAVGRTAPVLGVLPSLLRTVRSILFHDRFGKCGVQASRRAAHLAAFYGFMALYVVTIWAVIDIYVNPALGIESQYPFGLLHPMKLLANVGGVLLIYGGVKTIIDRRRTAAGTPVSTSFDWIFVSLLVGVGVTGFATEVFRFTVEPSAAGAAVTIAYAVYFIHLVLVFQLLVYLPYSKFAHVLYRTAAMVYAEHTGRTTNGRRLTPATGAALHAQDAERPKPVEAVATT
jgi:quinone-modifying oxidoreductase subunit QmoC